MLYQKQAFKHNPAENSFGDCHRTSLANLLHLPRDSVPNFGEYYDDYKKFNAAQDAWLVDRNLRRLEIPFLSHLDGVLNSMEILNPGIPYILGGTSANGWGHSVLACGGEIVCDPSIDDSGIVGPMEDGYYWTTFLIPIDYSQP